MKNIKSKLITSIAVLVGCVTLLVGTSFAWFTDSITNSGNKIQAGELKISATAYDLGTGGKSYTVSGVNGGKAFTFEADGQDLATVNTPIINETDWEPGKTSAKLLTVSNEDQLSAKIKLSFTTAGELTNALWYDFVQVGESGVTGTFTQREMSTLSAFAGAMEFTLETNETLSFIFVYGMKTSAGNEYQGKEFTADVTILATQAAVEEDGFGNSDYDSGAEYPAVNASELKDALTNGGSVSLGNNIAVVPNGPNEDVLYPQITVNKDTNLDLNGKELSVNVATNENLVYTPAIISVNKGTLTLNGNGTLTAEAGDNNSYGITIEGGTVIINDGNYFGAITAVQVESGHLEINGGFFDLAPTCKAQVPKYAKYIVNCIDEAYKSGTATIEIKGGTFVNFNPSDGPEGAGTSYVADGYKVESQEQDNGEIWYTVVPE